MTGGDTWDKRGVELGILGLMYQELKELGEGDDLRRSCESICEPFSVSPALCWIGCFFRSSVSLRLRVPRQGALKKHRVTSSTTLVQILV